MNLVKTAKENSQGTLQWAPGNYQNYSAPGQCADISTRVEASRPGLAEILSTQVHVNIKKNVATRGVLTRVESEPGLV